MRKKLLGAMAALVAGAGGAVAQSPTVGTGAARVGRPDTGFGDIRPAQFNPAVPPRLPDGVGLPPGVPGNPAEPGMPPGPMPGGPNVGGPNGEPMWPTPGPYMQQNWEQPPTTRQGLLGGLGGSPTNAPTLWFDGQYLLMFPKAMPTGLSLVTTGAPAGLGAIGQANTTTLHGGSDLSLGTASGFRLTAGFFRPSDHRFGFELTTTYVAPTSNDFFGQSANNGVPVIARPFFNTRANAQGSLIVAFPNFAAGSILSRATSEFWGMEANGVANLFRSSPDVWLPCSLNAILGFRFNSLEETLDISQSSRLLGTNTAPYAGITVASPTTLEVRDSFATSTRFFGGQFGLQWQVTAGRWYAGLSAKVGLGVAHQEVRVDGASGSNNPTAAGGVGIATVTTGGLFANASNIGVYRADRFGVVTDLNATVGYNVTRFFTLTAGYNFIHMNTVARPTNQYSGAVDPALVPTSGSYGAAPVAANPPFVMKQADYWLQGVNFGFIVRY